MGDLVARRRWPSCANVGYYCAAGVEHPVMTDRRCGMLACYAEEKGLSLEAAIRGEIKSV